MRKSVLVIVFILLKSLSLSASELVIAYGDYDVAPFVIMDNGELSGGIIKDIGDEIAGEMGLTPVYLMIPRKRLTNMVESGEVHLRIVFNPDWVQDPEEFYWSSFMFSDKDIIVIRKEDERELTTMSDFTDRNIGAVMGHIYPDLQGYFNAEIVRRDDSINLATNLSRLERNRVDGVITTEMSFAYSLKSYPGNEDVFIDSGIVSQVNEQHIMISKNTPWPKHHFDQAFKIILDTDRLEGILSRYR